MRTRIVFSTAAVVLTAVAAGCAEQPTTYQLPVHTEVSASKSHSLTNYQAHATGDQEVPARETLAQGQLKLQLSKDGESLEYKLIVANIENVVAAHLHRGAAGFNGPPVVWLAGPFAPAGGRTDGVLAQGTITAADLINMPNGSAVADLIAAIEAGNIYVNVHTSDGDNSTGPAAGDFPGGEVRGQVE